MQEGTEVDGAVASGPAPAPAPINHGQWDLIEGIIFDWDPHWWHDIIEPNYDDVNDEDD